MYMRRRGHEVIDRGGTRRNIKSPPPSLAQPDTVRACEVTCSQLLSPNPDWHEAHACWTFRGPGPPTSGKGARLLLGCRAVWPAPPTTVHYTTLHYSTYLPPPLSTSWSGNCLSVLAGAGGRGSLITCPRPGGPVNVTSPFPSPFCVVDFVASDSGLAQAGVLPVL